MARSVPKSVLDDVTSDYVYSATRAIEGGTVSDPHNLWELYDGEREFHQSELFKRLSPSPDHLPGGSPGYLIVRAPGNSPHVKPFPTVYGAVEDYVDMDNLQRHYKPTEVWANPRLFHDQRGGDWEANPNLFWEQPHKWFDTYLENTGVWHTSWVTFPQGPLDLFCLGPIKNRWEWGRRAAGVTYGEMEISRLSTQVDYVISLYAPFSVNGKEFPADKLTKLTSQTVLLECAEPTVFVHAYHIDNL